MFLLPSHFLNAYITPHEILQLNRRASYCVQRAAVAIFAKVKFSLEDAMTKYAILLSVICFAYPISGHTAIYECTIDGAALYQDTPCEAGQTAIALVGAPVRVPNPNGGGPSVVKQESQPRSPFQFTGLVVGMTDTAVLNLRGWGRPDNITRSRANRVWREEWIYFSLADGQKLLQFANGKLTAISTDPVASPGPERLAQFTPQ